MLDTGLCRFCLWLCFNIAIYYRFYISFENAICKDYITEKTYNALKLNTIPIVLGGVNYTDILPPHSFINAAEFISPQGKVPFWFLWVREPPKTMMAYCILCTTQYLVCWHFLATKICGFGSQIAGDQRFLI